ncbi:ribosomal protein L11 methyltransferase [Clostridia bacterium]|nr:ribosomal protein L11 methyltransferase [Clostridia bacterium]
MKTTYLKTVIHTTTAGAEALAPLLERCGVISYCVEDTADLVFVTGSAAGAVWDFVDPALEAEASTEVLVSFYLAEDLVEDLAEVSTEDSAENQAAVIESVKIALAKLTTDAATGVYGENADFGTLLLETEFVRDDWVERSRASFHTFSPAKGIVIRPPWEEPLCGADETVLVIDPGMAFGTGSHETTSMCLAALAEALDTRIAADFVEKQKEDADDVPTASAHDRETISVGRRSVRVLDVGTGSGILAIYAALRGAERVVAVEIDPDAAASARENLENNGVSDGIELIVGDVCVDGVLPKGEFYDLILANLTCRLLASLLPVLKKRLALRGSFILSGLLDTQEGAIREAVCASGLAVSRILRQGEWIAVLAGEGLGSAAAR